MIIPKDLYRQIEGHGYDAGCECDLVEGDPKCTIQPPYETLDVYINRLLTRVMKAESDLKKAEFTLDAHHWCMEHLDEILRGKNYYMDLCEQLEAALEEALKVVDEHEGYSDRIQAIIDRVNL
jgi:hypothetical protein